MATPPEPLITDALDYLAGLVADMGIETGRRRNYRGCERALYDFFLEDDGAVPVWQLGLGDSDQKSGFGNEVGSGLMRHLEEIEFRIHLPADTMPDGKLDTYTPAMEARADLHDVIMADRQLNGRQVVIWYLRSRRQNIASKEAAGITLREFYGLEWDHATGNMGALPS